MKVLFLIYHGQGHFNACFKLARYLRQQHEVLFAGVEFFRGYLLQQDLPYHALQTVPFGLGLEHWHNKVKGRKPIYWNTLKDRWTDLLYQLRERELKSLLDQYQPDIIFLDAQQATDFIVLYPHVNGKNKRLILVHTMLPQETPYLTGSKFLKQRLLYLGLDDHRIIRRRQIENKIPGQYFSKRQSNLGCVLQNIPEIVLAPREFDMTNSSASSGTRFLGFQPDYNRKETYSEDYHTFREKVGAGHFSNRKILFFAFGTILSGNKHVNALIQKVCEVAASEGYVLIIASGEKEKIKEAVSHPDILVFDKVPQLDVLTFADVFITHGGLNSIGESVLAGVPMLVCTVQNKMDAQKNAERIMHHGLGLQITLDEPIDGLKSKIKALLTEPNFRMNVQHLKSQNEAYALESFAKDLENIDPIS